MWFPYGVPQAQAPGYAVPQLPQAPLPPSVPQLPLSESQTSNRISKRKVCATTSTSLHWFVDWCILTVERVISIIDPGSDQKMPI